MKKPGVMIHDVIVDQRVELWNLEQGTQYENCIVYGDGDPVRLNSVAFKKCTFVEVDFKRSEILDCLIENCDFSNIEFDDSYMYRVAFKNCKFLASSLFKCVVKDVLFSNNLMNYLNFSDNKVNDVTFENTQLVESSFQNLEHKNLVFADVKIDKADFTETKLSGLDLRKADFTSISYSPRLAQGLTIRMDQGISLLAQFGIIVD
ncbi:hypothetical protein G7062_10785 [Erysipelothrix sp. HDW6C]|uniref:pentapeptide repeat-containing protein n=1 Tax=Erysipelothrix sp. HDW6C TaxID=2714930 RepID=UPI00140B3703|nr:pentapeptide repeat-containing protein [Erysipelothrix sp. HDW6C]QIK70749.1 hypothetical protein G7062_10785 [Erysipelothrix sp. HDW6C]